jgi:hypothetical protein
MRILPLSKVGVIIKIKIMNLKISVIAALVAVTLGTVLFLGNSAKANCGSVQGCSGMINDGKGSIIWLCLDSFGFLFNVSNTGVKEVSGKCGTFCDQSKYESCNE